MKIYSDVLAEEDIRGALQRAGSGLGFEEFRPLGKTRVRRHGWDILLYRDGSARRFNTGTMGAGSQGAASRDDYGEFLAVLFGMDPRLRAGPYDGLDAFRAATGGRYRTRLGYGYLASIAATPDPGHADTFAGDVHAMDGAYWASPLGDAIGLHIHTPSDMWYEDEPERPVHFIVGGAKIAAVYPAGVVNVMRTTWGPGWRQSMIEWGLHTRLSWLDRLLTDNKETTMDEIANRRNGNA